MLKESPYRLLGRDDPPPVIAERLNGASALFLTCEHAGRRIPSRLGDLGVSEAELKRHIGWDIGAAGVARGLSEQMDAALVMQTYSRLVIDCNRKPSRHDSIARISEHTEIPGNHDLRPDHAEARVREIFTPYHDTIASELDRRRDAGRATLLMAVHSFTPVFKGVARPWHIGLLYNRDDRVARVLMELVTTDPTLPVGDNEPYAISDESDYTIPVHGEQRGILSIEIEIRQDLIETEAGQRDWALRLTDWIGGAIERLTAAKVP
jgi:predicted N-formylglutamate amidohydrolase